MGPGTLPEVRDGSENHRRVPGRVVGPSRRSEMGLGDPPEGPRWVGGPSRRSKTGPGTLPEVRDGLGDPPEGPGRVGGTLLEVRDGSGDSRGGSRWVERQSGKSGTGRSTVVEVRDE